MRLIKFIILTGLVLFMAASTASAERSLWLAPKDTNGEYITDAYVWKDPNPWLRKSYVVGAEPFLLEISNHSLGKGKKDKTAKNVRLVVAISDPEKVDNIFINGLDIWDPASVKEGVPKLASGRRMPKHGVFPASFIEVDIDDIAQNESVEVLVEVYGKKDLMVHFDAYGEGRPKKCKHKYQHKYYKDRWYHKHYWYKWHHKYYKGKWHHKHPHHKKTCYRDVFNPFSHDVTVVVEDSGSVVCGPEDISINFQVEPETVEIPIDTPVRFTISQISLTNCTVDNAALVVELPDIFFSVTDQTGHRENFDGQYVDMAYNTLTLTEINLPFMGEDPIFFDSIMNNSTFLIDNYTAWAFLEYDDDNDPQTPKVTSQKAEVTFEVKLYEPPPGGGGPPPR